MKEIKYVKYRDIDKAKWDDCMQRADNGLIYGLSVYLDTMSENWDALILNDYETVMPLTRKRKFGIPHLYQPFFIQQSGVFGKYSYSPEITSAFLATAVKRFPKIHIHLNFANAGFGTPRCNLVLNLQRPFAELQRHFRKDLVGRAVRAGLFYKEGGYFGEVISLFTEYYGSKTRLEAIDFQRFYRLCSRLQALGMIKVRRVESKNGQLLSAAIFFVYKKRIYYIMSVLHPQGRKVDATAFLIFKVLEEHSGRDITFDFEGSEIASIKFFFKKFHASEEPYYLFRKGWF